MSVAAAAATFDTGTVSAVVDASHVEVDLGDKTVTVSVPASLLGAAGVGAFVRVAVQERTCVLDSVLSNPAAGLVPVGCVIMWAGSSVPTGWLRLDGSTYSSTTYPLLYAVLGSTTLPDMRDRLPRGASTGAAVKSTGGSTTITEANLPAHTHSLGGHTHTISNIGIGTLKEPDTGTSKSIYYPSGASSATSGPSSDTSGSAGSGAAYWQPYVALHYLIKAA